MPKPRPKTNAQTGRMFGLAKPLAAKAGMETDEYLRLVVASLTSSKNGSISVLTFDEANTVIKSLGGDVFPARGNSYRMQNHRKQEAGIKTIETEAHLTKIRELATERWGSEKAEDAIEKLAARMHTPWPPSTTEQGNRLVEALKAMNARDRVSSPHVSGAPAAAAASGVEVSKGHVVTGNFGSKSKPAASEPSFRRVA